MIEKLKRKHPELTDRGIQMLYVKTLTCTQCGENRLMVGSAQDPWRLRCLHCGHLMRPKNPPKELSPC